jgi:hypothetical protein
MLGRTWQLAFVQHLRHDALIERCLAIATVGGRGVVGSDANSSQWTAGPASMPGLGVGDPADLLLLPGESLTSAVMDRRPERLVLRQGRVIAVDGSLLDCRSEGQSVRAASRHSSTHHACGANVGLGGVMCTGLRDEESSQRRADSE